jgi:hypothetical protein
LLAATGMFILHAFAALSYNIRCPRLVKKKEPGKVQTPCLKQRGVNITSVEFSENAPTYDGFYDHAIKLVGNYKY